VRLYDAGHAPDFDRVAGQDLLDRALVQRRLADMIALAQAAKDIPAVNIGSAQPAIHKSQAPVKIAIGNQAFLLTLSGANVKRQRPLKMLAQVVNLQGA